MTPTRSESPQPVEPLYDDGAVGVYIHLPFCERICPYCDFAVVAARSLGAETEAPYVSALLAELEARAPDFASRRLATLYLGGGTPSLFSPEAIARLVRAVRDVFGGGGGGRGGGDGGVEETTLEVNPSTVERERLPGFREAGVDRLSVGVQSFDDTLLRRLGRAHRADEAHATLAAARRAGFENLSIDLMFAGPGQTEADLDRDLDAAIAFGPEHVSTYELTWEPETPFGRALADGRFAACDEDLAAAMIERIEQRLAAVGFERYEISSHARPGFRARHNARYWRRQAVLGLGMGAHSLDPRAPGRPFGARRANPRRLEAWLDALRGGRGPESEEIPSAATARGEAIFLGLRQREGVAAAAFAAEFGGPPRVFFGPEIDRLVACGWLEEEVSPPGDLRLTAAGRLVADSVAAEFVVPAGADDEAVELTLPEPLGIR